MHERQGCLVACVRTEPSTEKVVQTHQTEPDVALEYRTHRMHRTQSPHYQSQEATPPYLNQDGFLLMPTTTLLKKNDKRESPRLHSFYSTTHPPRNKATTSHTKMGKSKLVCSSFPPFPDGNCAIKS